MEKIPIQKNSSANLFSLVNVDGEVKGKSTYKDVRFGCCRLYVIDVLGNGIVLNIEVGEKRNVWHGWCGKCRHRIE